MPKQEPFDNEAKARYARAVNYTEEDWYANPWWPSTHITDALVTLHADGIRTHYDSQSDETFTECLICGDWEGHRDHCPYPAIEKWMGEE